MNFKRINNIAKNQVPIQISKWKFRYVTNSIVKVEHELIILRYTPFNEMNEKM